MGAMKRVHLVIRAGTLVNARFFGNANCVAFDLGNADRNRVGWRSDMGLKYSAVHVSGEARKRGQRN
jgi:hypothetical protein